MATKQAIRIQMIAERVTQRTSRAAATASTTPITLRIARGRKRMTRSSLIGSVVDLRVAVMPATREPEGLSAAPAELFGAALERDWSARNGLTRETSVGATARAGVRRKPPVVAELRALRGLHDGYREL